MRRKIHLSTLSVGRCFTLIKEPGGASEDNKEGITRQAPILAADDAWKVVGEADQGLACQNARGVSKTFAEDTEVVEIPRQGFDRLVERG